MSDSTTVLVLATNEQSHLVERLFDEGFVPLVRGNMFKAMEKLRHDRFAAVLIDRDDADADVLEFILNVRDVDEHVPIVVVGETSDELESQAVFNQPNIYSLPKDRADFEAELKRLVTGKDGA